MLDLVWEITYMSAFVFGIGYGLHYVAYLKGLGNKHDVVKPENLKKRVKQKNGKLKTGNSFLDKWLEFGGGYYGSIALIHLIFIELAQIKEFIADWPGGTEFINGLGINTLVTFFIEQIMNFVAAISWPVDYLGRYSIAQIAIFIGITYLAYQVSRKIARTQVNKVLAGDAI